MRFKTAGLIILVTFLILVLGFSWQFREIQRTSADLVQLGGTKTVQPNSTETDDVVLSLTDNLDGVNVSQKVTYTISYSAKKDLKQARIVATLGDTNKKIYPTFSWDLGNVKTGASGSFNIPVEIKKGETDLAISRVTISRMSKSNWWSKEKREILATVDDINQVTSQ